MGGFGVTNLSVTYPREAFAPIIPVQILTDCELGDICVTRWTKILTAQEEKKNRSLHRLSLLEKGGFYTVFHC